jgi:hypothetical protein
MCRRRAVGTEPGSVKTFYGVEYTALLYEVRTIVGNPPVQL